MPGVCFRPRPGISWLAALIAAGSPAGATAQPTAVPPETTVYLILRTGPNETPEGILGTLKLGIEKSGAAIAGEPTIKTVSPAFLEEFEALVDQASGGPVVAAKDGASIRLLPSRETVYEVKLAPTQILKTLAVTYEKAGEKVYSPTAPGGKSPLVLTVPGRYAFTPEPADNPTAYAAAVAELGKPDTELKGKWPAADKCFVVTLRNFRGDRKVLFDTIQNPKLVANPLKNVRLGNDLVFAFASLNSDAAKRKRGRITENNELVVTIETLPDRNPKRVWVYFPLDETQMAAAREKYQKFGVDTLPGEIRKDAVPADRVATVGPKDAPKWLELPAGTPGEFRRTIKLTDPVGLAKTYPALWMLVVWEFDNGTPQIIKVQDPKGEPAVVLGQEFDDWQKDIQAATRRPAKP